MTRSFLLLLAVLSIALTCQALMLPQAISSNMVLQRAPQQARIWGWAAAASTVTVSLDSVSNRVYADSTGAWYVDLPPQMSSTSRSIIIAGDGQTITLSNVAFGDVYICSGQSNMEFTVGMSFDAKTAIPDSINYPNLRLFGAARKASLTPLNDTINRWTDGSRWVVSQPKYVGGASWDYFSAVCYYFGRELYIGLNGSMPIGLVDTCWGGTRIEAWTTPQALETCGPVSPDVDLEERRWQQRAFVSDETVPSADPSMNTASVLYNAMIAPLINMRVRGVVWYQGEENASNATNYACRFPAMINDWRQQFSNFRLDFYFVLLAAWREAGFPRWPLIRQAQLTALSLSYTAVASAQDLGDETGGVHSHNKTLVGVRLALTARAQIYGQNVVYLGPSAADIVWPIDGQPVATAILRFRPDDPASQGLHIANTSRCVACCNMTGSPIQLATSDGAVYRAAVTVIPSSYIVTATIDLSATPDVKVVALWNNWESYSECAIYNSANLPHLPVNIARP